MLRSCQEVLDVDTYYKPAVPGLARLWMPHKPQTYAQVSSLPLSVVQLWHPIKGPANEDDIVLVRSIRSLYMLLRRRLAQHRWSQRATYHAMLTTPPADVDGLGEVVISLAPELDASSSSGRDLKGNFHTRLRMRENRERSQNHWK